MSLTTPTISYGGTGVADEHVDALADRILAGKRRRAAASLTIATRGESSGRQA